MTASRLLVLVAAAWACLIALVSTPAQADLPIHCLNAQIAGEWTFTLDQGGHEPHSSTSLSQVACGYSQPDRNADHFLRPSILVGITELKLSLREPNIVVDEQGKQGTWTMVYDEGFEVALADGRRFFAYSKYVPNAGTSLSSDKLAGYTSHCDETMVGWYHDAANRNWGCYRGVQTKAANAWTSSVTRTLDDGVDVAPVVSPNALIEEFARVLHRDTHDEEIDAAEQAVHDLEAVDAAADADADADNANIFLEEDAEVETDADTAESLDLEAAFGAVPHPRSHVATEMPELDDTVLFEPDHVFIERHNANTRNTWKAGTHEQFHKKPVKEMLKMLGMKRYQKHPLAHHLNKKPQQRQSNAAANAPVKVSTKRRAADSASLREKDGTSTATKKRTAGGKKAKAQSKLLDAPRQPIQDTRSDAEKYAGLPTHWDWSSRNGVSYDTEIRNQGSCGSCYAMATISAIESRYRVASRLTFRPIISPQEIVSCSFYNQGCEGGYPFLVGKHGAEFGMTQAECHPYTARNSECAAPQSQGIAPSSCSMKARLAMTNYSYVGGYMGGCSEVAMMREIYANGPVMVAFQAPPDLFYYTGGIYTGPSPKEEKQGVNGVNVWQQTNHAVVAVGWGVDAKTGMKYWKLKNTWGQRWGEGGYFRIRRGTNECGVESMATKVDVILPADVSVPPNAPNPHAEEETKSAPPAASKHRLMQHRHEHAATHRRGLPQSPVRRRHMLPASAIEYD